MFLDSAPALVPAPVVVVVGTREAAHHHPGSEASVSAEELRTTTAVRNTEDALRYLPSLVVRKRHVGDTQAPLATRTSGVGASARSLVFADGVLLSALVGNNNNFASPRWGLVSPEEIARVDVLYGPFSAAYPGNAIGAVVNITTRMPDSLEASATLAGNVQHFRQYRTRKGGWAGQAAATVGDRFGGFGWFLSVNHVESDSQPLAYITTAANVGAGVTGAVPGVSRTGAPVSILGAGGLERQTQDMVKARATLDLGKGLKAGWQNALFRNSTDSKVETYLRDANGAPVFTNAFSAQRYLLEQRHWLNSASIEQTGDRFYWSLVGSRTNYARDDQRLPTGLLPGAEAGGPGALVRLGGTRWSTLDWHGYTRMLPRQELHGGVHFDRFRLSSRRFATSAWQAGAPGALIQQSSGDTRTTALWIEDQIDLTPTLLATVGLRREWWRAANGRNYSAAPFLDVTQPARRASGWSPKLALRWTPVPGWTARLALARALRFPTVSELYQTSSVGSDLRVPSPDLRPERARSAELALEHRLLGGNARLAFFTERIDDALLTQTAPLAGSTVLFSYVQNVGRTRTRGAELALEELKPVRGVEVSGSVTIADPRTVADAAFPAAVGKLIPQVPKRKATLEVTWRPNNAWALTGAVRASSRLYGTINNSDVIGHTWQGFEGYVVGDVRVQRRISDRLSIAASVENVTDRRYFLFHPFPGRTVSLELHWGWNGHRDEAAGSAKAM